MPKKKTRRAQGPSKAKTKIRVGTTFRLPLADGNPLWKIVKILRPGVYQCQVVEDEPDWAGCERVFAREEVQKALGIQAFWEDIENANVAFYEGLAVGEVVHYHDGFGQFVRCEVVLATEQHELRGLELGKPCLRKIALVGHWTESDIERKASTLDQMFRPHAENIYENPRATSTHRWPDPSKAEPLVIAAASATT